jgi:hypothetical protein
LLGAAPPLRPLDGRDSPRAWPPYLFAVALFEYGAPPRCWELCCQLLLPPVLMLALRLKLLFTLMLTLLPPQPHPQQEPPHAAPIAMPTPKEMAAVAK